MNAAKMMTTRIKLNLATLFLSEGVKVADVDVSRAGVAVECSTKADAEKVADMLKSANCANVAFDLLPESEAWTVVSDFPAKAA